MKLLIMILMISSTSHAMEYDVDMPGSDDPKYEMARINIDGCDTVFKISKKAFINFDKNSHAMDEMIDKAKAHSAAGCPK